MSDQWEQETETMGYPASKPTKAYRVRSMVGGERVGRAREPFNPGSDVTMGEVWDLVKKLRKVGA